MCDVRVAVTAAVVIHTADATANVTEGGVLAISQNVETCSLYNAWTFRRIRLRMLASLRGLLDHPAITEIETIAVGPAIREQERLNKVHGQGRWRKLKGRAFVRLPGGRVRLAEIHWYEAHGIGKRDFKIKRYLD